MKQEYRFDPALKNYTHIDAMILNIERACQAAIDAAQHIVARDRLGMPQNSAEAFIMLEEAGILGADVARSMVAMTGFRNVAVHEYQALDKSVLHRIATQEYQSLIDFCRAVGVRVDVPEDE
ncbi:MAG: DUF86 domain-containing protein [Spirochaetaceae bacterium]|nr:MAG: DUF86 domain-containing protein [Spirochaetaceae bacterium]